MQSVQKPQDLVYDIEENKMSKTSHYPKVNFSRSWCTLSLNPNNLLQTIHLTGI